MMKLPKLIRKKGEPLSPRLRQGLAFLLSTSFVLLAVGAVVYRDEWNYDAVKRYFAYQSLERSDSGQTESFRHDSGVYAHFTDLAEDLFLASSGGVKIFSSGGINYLSDSVVLSSPITAVNGNFAIVYEAGGSRIRSYTNRQLVFSDELESSRNILSANISKQGQLVLTTEETGYKGSVTVYKPDFSPLLSLRLSSCFIFDALLSDDGKTIGVLTSGQTGANFETALSLYNLTNDEPFATVPLDSDINLDLVWNDNAFWAISNSSLTTVDSSGKALGSYDFSSSYLKAFSLEGDGFATLLLGKYRAGTQATLVTIDRNGNVLASLELNEQVLSLESTGRYLSVLTASGLHVYTKNLNHYSTLEETAGIRDVVLRSDGTAYLLDSENAHLYIPR